MSKIKDWILWQQEIDSQDDPDMEDSGDAEFRDEKKALEEFHAGDAGARNPAREGEVNPQ